MPSHQERIRAKNPEMNCEHVFEYTFGIDVYAGIVAAKMCVKCMLIVKLGYLGVDKIEDGWHKWYMHSHA
jgi:hypothetical protein